MMMMRAAVRMSLIAGPVVLGLAACGVKSEPAFPEGAPFPLIYPAPAGTSAAVPRDRPATGETRTAPPTDRTTAPGAYAPPPPATEILAQ